MNWSDDDRAWPAPGQWTYDDYGAATGPER